jgi:hypothetical protein
MSQSRLIRLEADILGKNARYAAANRDRFTAQGILALNLVSSPGSGKTTLLCRTLEAIGADYPVAVIEGDQQTSQDADRIRATGAPAIQINTGKGATSTGTWSAMRSTIWTRRRAACCSSRTWAIWSARRPSIWARARAWRSFR